MNISAPRPSPLIRELRDLQRGKVCLSANEYHVMSLLRSSMRTGRCTRTSRSRLKEALRVAFLARCSGVSREIGVVSFKPTDTSLKAVPLVTDELALIVSPHIPWQNNNRSRFASSGWNPLLPHVPSPYRERVVRLLKGSRRRSIFRWRCPLWRQSNALSNRGQSVALMPRLAAQTKSPPVVCLRSQCARCSRTSIIFDLTEQRRPLTRRSRIPQDRKTTTPT